MQINISLTVYVLLDMSPQIQNAKLQHIGNVEGQQLWSYSCHTLQHVVIPLIVQLCTARPQDGGRTNYVRKG